MAQGAPVKIAQLRELDLPPGLDGISALRRHLEEDGVPVEEAFFNSASATTSLSVHGADFLSAVARGDYPDELTVVQAYQLFLEHPAPAQQSAPA
jgi:hypothetical protein